jgi:hypothetical protein
MTAPTASWTANFPNAVRATPLASVRTARPSKRSRGCWSPIDGRARRRLDEALTSPAARSAGLGDGPVGNPGGRSARPLAPEVPRRPALRTFALAARHARGAFTGFVESSFVRWKTGPVSRYFSETSLASIDPCLAPHPPRWVIHVGRSGRTPFRRPRSGDVSRETWSVCSCA